MNQTTSYAIPAAIAVGIMTSFVYSVVVLDSTVTWTRLLGLAVVLLGIYLLK